MLSVISLCKPVHHLLLVHPLRTTNAELVDHSMENKASTGMATWTVNKQVPLPGGHEAVVPSA